ncbi:hypothetical protein ACP275_10G150100 [Erythranthe tilingii]
MSVTTSFGLRRVLAVGLMPKGGFSETWFIPLHVAITCNADSLLAPQRGHADEFWALCITITRGTHGIISSLVFSLSLAFAVGLTCAFTSVAGKVILESVILTAAVMTSLTLYTFWAAKRGHDFNFLGPFLFDFLPIGSYKRNDLRLFGIHNILWVHRLRH